MCKIDGCERHVLWNEMCLPHLKEALAPKPKRKRRTKKVDAVELLTTDAVESNEERNDTDE